MIDDRIRGALTIYNTRSVAAVEFEDAAEDTQIDKVEAGKKKFKKRGKQVRIAEIDSDDEEDETADASRGARIAALQKKQFKPRSGALRCSICRSRQHPTSLHPTGQPRAFPPAGRHS